MISQRHSVFWRIQDQDPELKTRFTFSRRIKWTSGLDLKLSSDPEPSVTSGLSLSLSASSASTAVMESLRRPVKSHLCCCHGNGCDWHLGGEPDTEWSMKRLLELEGTGPGCCWAASGPWQREGARCSRVSQAGWAQGGREGETGEEGRWKKLQSVGQMVSGEAGSCCSVRQPLMLTRVLTFTLLCLTLPSFRDSGWSWNPVLTQFFWIILWVKLGSIV